MRKTILLFTVITLTGTITAQESDEKDWGIKFSGFVNSDFFLDSRQTVTAREGHFLLWPAAENLDPNNEDINAKASFNMLSIRTRLRGTISGPDVLGAQTSAVIEGAFFGHRNSDLNGFRLRHAFAKLNWENTELIVGQYWHPMFITSCFPGTISFNTGAPFQPFSRNPQIRLTHELGSITLSATALSHIDFYSAEGIAAHRNSGMPEFNVQAFYNKPATESNAGILLGGGAGYKRLVPEIQTILGYKTNAAVGSFMTEIYGKITLPKITVKLEGTFGQNNYDLLMISSFATTSIDAATGIPEYTPTSSFSAWTEVIYNDGSSWQPGIFAGYTKSLGAGKDILPGTLAGSRGNIDYVYRISPRMMYSVGKMKFGLELEYTAAAFGTLNTQAEVENSVGVGNIRTLLSAFYFF